MRALTFHLPEGIIYLDDNSLGQLGIDVEKRLVKTLRDEWGEMLITAWNEADWMQKPAILGDRIAKMLGAPDACREYGVSVDGYRGRNLFISRRFARRRFPSHLG